MVEDVKDFVNAHEERQAGCLLTMLTFKTRFPSSCGINVEIDDKKVLQAFHEKIEKPPGDRANGAMYAFDQEFLNHLNLMNPSPTDFSTEVIPKLMGKIHKLGTQINYIWTSALQRH